MNRKIITQLIFFTFFCKLSFSQQYFKIEGTNRIFTAYGNKGSVLLNDTVSIFYYIRYKNFYLAIKRVNNPLKTYLRYDALQKKEQNKVFSLNRGTGLPSRSRLIYVNILTPQKTTSDSDFIKSLINSY